MRADYFDTYADVMPTLSRLRKEGTWFSQARATSLPTVTGVGHATIGTGTDPRFHGITVNNLFNRVTGKFQPAYDALDPETVGQRIVESVQQLTASAMSVLYRVDAETGDMHLLTGIGPQVEWNTVLRRGTATVRMRTSYRQPGWVEFRFKRHGIEIDGVKAQVERGASC